MWQLCLFQAVVRCQLGLWSHLQLSREGHGQPSVAVALYVLAGGLAGLGSAEWHSQLAAVREPQTWRQRV